MTLTALDINYLKKKAISKRRNTSGKITNPIRRARRILKILENDNFQCVQCGSKTQLTIDHINGRKFAKHDDAKKYRASACQTLCIKCHYEKHDN